MLLSNNNHFVIRLICDKNLISDKFVSVWKFTVLGKREYMGVHLDVLQVLGVWKHCKYIIFVLRASLSVVISFLSHLRRGGKGFGFRGESPHRVIVLGSESRITVN